MEDLLQRTTRTTVAREDEMAIGSMKMVKVDGRRLVLVRTSTGFHALDNACPHEGYGLVQGGLDGDLLTCEWHNWKFDVSDGSCVLGEEAVASHDVTVVDGEVVVTVVRPDLEQIRAAASASLDRGIDAQYNGQIARDSLRLLHAGAEPHDIIWQALHRTAPRTEYGWTHAMAMTADCLTALDGVEGDDRLGPVAQAVSALAESELRRPVRPRPVPAPSLRSRSQAPSQDMDGFATYQRLVETEQADAADALLTGALLGGMDRDEAARWLIQATCDHHLDFGHGAIYTQKAFEMLDALGWERAAELLPHLSYMHVMGTREDKLPYMRPFLHAVADAGLTARWSEAADPAWSGRAALVRTLVGTDPVAGAAAVSAALDGGAGIVGVIDAVALAASERMLRHDLNHERHPDVTGYGWLDITHSLTYVNAARWAWTTSPGEHTARLAMFTVFHVIDGGRDAAPAVEPVESVLPSVESRRSVSLVEALAANDPDAAVAAALTEPVDTVATALVQASLDDRSGALIVVAHHVKTARAAIREAEHTGSRLPLAAAARFIAAPARQRFVSQAVLRARHFLTTGTPPPR